MTNKVNNKASIKVYNQESLDINIYSAFDIDKEQINQIAKTVAKKYNFKPQTVTFKIEKDLIAGVRVVFDSNVIDNSLKAKLKTLEENTKNKI